VTWRSDTGQALLYDNGRLAWEVVRGKGKRIPSGGTLVVGREQGTHAWPCELQRLHLPAV
jgi:hypothetical protein